MALFFTEVIWQKIGSFIVPDADIMSGVNFVQQESAYRIYLIISFASTFVFYFITLIFFSSGRFNYSFVFLILFAIMNLFIGFANGWYLSDIIGDTARFISPLLAYFVGMNLFRKINIDEIKIVFKIILKIFLYILFFEALIRFGSIIFFKEPFIRYPDGDVDVPILLFSTLSVFWLYNKNNLNFTLLAGSILLFFLLSPIMSVSRSGLISVVVCLLFIPFKFGKTKHILITLIFLSFITFYILNNEIAVFLIKRITETISGLIILGSNDSIIDDSTFSRIIEARGAYQGIINSAYYPLSLLIGTGSGSLWYSTADFGTGLAAGNFRGDGGAHHIHIELVSLWFRHGLLGLMIYLSWILIVLRNTFIIFKYFYNSDYFIMSLMAGVSTVIFASFFMMMTDLSIYGHFIYGLLGAVPAVFLEKVNKKNITIKNKVSS